MTTTALNSHTDSWNRSQLFMISNEFQTMRELSFNINRATHSKVNLYFIGTELKLELRCMKVLDNVLAIKICYLQLYSNQCNSFKKSACYLCWGSHVASSSSASQSDAFRCDCHLSNWLSERKMLVMLDCDRALLSAFAADKLCTANC